MGFTFESTNPEPFAPVKTYFKSVPTCVGSDLYHNVITRDGKKRGL